MHAGEELSRRGTSASPLEDDDLLGEILLRLPPQPASLPRASAVCRRWEALVTDARFRRRFRVHHRKPPLLGAFANSMHGIVFLPVLDPPNRIPTHRLDLGGCTDGDHCRVLDCRHGLLLLKDWGPEPEDLVVCDPITGEQRRVPIPPELMSSHSSGALLCAAGNQGHVHGGCPFKVVLMGMCIDVNRPSVIAYSSETGTWGNLISTEAPYQHRGDTRIPATLVGNALYWLPRTDQILLLEFDLDGQSLAMITGPPVTTDIGLRTHRIIRAEDGALGFAVLSFPRFQMWQRNVNSHGVATWLPWKTIEMHTVLGLPSKIKEGFQCVVGYCEDTDVVFFLLGLGIYMVQLKLMQSMQLYKPKYITECVPFTSFYTPGTAINGGSNGSKVLHNM